MLTATNQLPDRFWEEAASKLKNLVKPNDLLLAPNEFLWVFPGTIALHVRKRMLEHVTIAHFILHKGMLDLVDPLFLADAAQATPVFANEVFVIFSTRGEQLPADQAKHLSIFSEFVAKLPKTSAPSFKSSLVVTTYNRPWALERALKSLAKQSRPTVVIDDASSDQNRLQNERIATDSGAAYICYPVNLGLSNSINIGVGHWLAHPDAEWISVFNDDVEVIDGMFDILEEIVSKSPHAKTTSLYTGYLGDRHPSIATTSIADRRLVLAYSCPSIHLHAHRSYWQTVLPVPTAYLGAPKKSGGLFVGHGSDEDWWIASWSPNAAIKRGGKVIVIPDLVSTFVHEAALSTWDNKP
jgi:hypothetical protein